MAALILGDQEAGNKRRLDLEELFELWPKGRRGVMLEHLERYCPLFYRVDLLRLHPPRKGAYSWTLGHRHGALAFLA